MLLQDSIILGPPPEHSRDSTHVLVYFITGNPGLIEYYRTFLTELSHILLRLGHDNHVEYHLHGHSLAGFKLHSEPPSPPYSLQDQVEYTQRGIVTAAEWVRKRAGLDKDDRVPVILVGHSVGTYILLENIEAWLRAREEGRRQPVVPARDGPLEFLGGVCLFPTIVELASSPSGKRVFMIATRPGFASFVHYLVKPLSFCMPDAWLRTLVQKVNGMPDDAAAVTAAFLKSKGGVRQALHLARHELLEMTYDKWTDDLWGISRAPTASPDSARTQLYFYWAAEDHWIANATRDAVIARRAHTADDPAELCKPKMEIDTGGVPHDFCIRHSEPVARKVAEYVRQIVEAGAGHSRR